MEIFMKFAHHKKVNELSGWVCLYVGIGNRGRLYIHPQSARVIETVCAPAIKLVVK